MRRLLAVLLVLLTFGLTCGPGCAPAASRPAMRPPSEPEPPADAAPARAPVPAPPGPSVGAPGPPAAPRSPSGILSDAPDLGQLERLLQVMSPNDPGRPELLQRIGVGWARRADVVGEPRAMGMRRRAIATLQEIVDRYPNHGRVDEVLIEMAWTYRQLGQPAEAGAACERLLADYPLSSWVPDAHVLLGDLAFDAAASGTAAALAAARRHYEEAAQLQSRVQAYARYRLAWVLFNEADPAGALARFREAAQAAGRDRQPDLARAARADAMRAYAVTGEPAGAWDLLTSLGVTGDEERLNLALRLAGAYDDLGHDARATAMIESILARRPGVVACALVRAWLDEHPRAPAALDAACPP